MEHSIPGLARKTRTQLINDKRAYVETVGRHDINTLGEAMIVPQGDRTVIRLIFGATHMMPTRSLSYAAAALQCARTIPQSQVQIIHANHLGERVNGVPIEITTAQSRLLGHSLDELIDESFPDLAHRVLHAQDSPMETNQFAVLAQSALDNNPAIARKLLAKGSKHGGDALHYTAAHFAFQDTDNLVLDPVLGNSPEQLPADRIISVGCMQESTFYMARMAMRAAAAGEISMVSSAQVFTRHLTPPYYIARGGEPRLVDVAMADLPEINLMTVGDIPARRDLAHLIHHHLQGDTV